MNLDWQIPEYLNQIDYARVAGNIYSLSFNTRHLARIYYQQNVDLNKALDYFQQSLEQRLSIGFKPYIPASYISIADVNVALNKFDIAEDMFKQAKKSADEIGFIRHQFNARFKLAQLYEKMGNINLAKQFYIDAKRNAEKNSYQTGMHQVLEKIQD